MMQTKNEMLESRTEAVSRDALVRAALHTITTVRFRNMR